MGTLNWLNENRRFSENNCGNLRLKVDLSFVIVQNIWRI